MSQDAPSTDEVEQAVQEVSRLAELARKSPMSVIAALFLGGTTLGTIGSLLVAPYVMPHVDAGIATHSQDPHAHEEAIRSGAKAVLEEHIKDPRGHATEFQRLTALEQRVDKLEAGYDAQGREIATMNGNLSAALRLLDP